MRQCGGGGSLKLKSKAQWEGQTSSPHTFSQGRDILTQDPILDSSSCGIMDATNIHFFPVLRPSCLPA